MVVVTMKKRKKMDKAIGDFSFFRRLFTENEPDRDVAVTELQIVHSYNYEILLPIAVLYCVVGTGFKRNPNNPEILKKIVKKYGLVLIDDESSWLKSIDSLFQHTYGQVATPMLVDMEVRSLIQKNSDISFLLTYQKEKYADLFHQIHTF